LAISLVVAGGESLPVLTTIVVAITVTAVTDIGAAVLFVTRVVESTIAPRVADACVAPVTVSGVVGEAIHASRVRIPVQPTLRCTGWRGEGDRREEGCR
jgi:hypothetical protein